MQRPILGDKDWDDEERTREAIRKFLIRKTLIEELRLDEEDTA